jgi:hypothetical protein
MAALRLLGCRSSLPILMPEAVAAVAAGHRSAAGCRLTTPLRALFDAKGYELVHQELIDNRYEKLEKRKAAIAWLAEQRKKQRMQEWIKFWIPVIISVVALIFSLAPYL